MNSNSSTRLVNKIDLFAGNIGSTWWIKESYYYFNVEICIFGCVLLNKAKTTEQI